MGPFLLVDKSFIRSISPREAKALQKHYSILLPPILLEELISALSDESREEQNRVKEVLNLVAKAHGLGSYTLHDARAMVEADLHGAKIGLTTQIPKFGGKEVVDADGSRGFILHKSFEDKLINAWGRGDFSELDRKVSGQLKRDFEAHDLPGSQKKMREQYPENTKFGSVQEIANFYDNPQTGMGRQWTIIEQVARWSLIDDAKLKAIQATWQGKNQPRFSEWAPYANYCSRVLFVYFIAVTAALVPTGKDDKSLIDVMYFMYLPFCHAFASGDKFHRDMFSVYKRPGQEFIWGPDLKKDLGVIASFHEALSPEDHRQFEIDYGHYPPPIPESLTNLLWQRQMSPWKPGSGNRVLARTDEENRAEHAELMRKIGHLFK